jgi:hypothetical protein
MRVRRAAGTACASSACSVGRKTLTSTDDGFSVPTTATTKSGQNSVSPANRFR